MVTHLFNLLTPDSETSIASCSSDISVLCESSLLSSSAQLFEFISFDSFGSLIQLVVAFGDDFFNFNLLKVVGTFSVFDEADDVDDDGDDNDDELEFSFIVFFFKSTQFGGGFSLSPP